MKTPRAKSNKAKAKPEPRGPAVWENWKAALAGREFPGAYEVPLYTDARITGELKEGYGPYQLLNIGARQRRGAVRTAIVLRAEAQLIFDSNEMVSQLKDLPRGKDSKRYHGGGRDDEVAALFSLSLGIRLKPGDWSRDFMPGDPKGTPRSAFGPEPVLLPRAYGVVIPRAAREQSLNDDTLVKHLPSLEPSDAFAVVRAARLYQDALWIAESQPALAWLMFVSAVETAAGHWQTKAACASEMLRLWNPDLEGLLREYGGDELVSKAADMLVELMRSKKKFVDFVLEFRPGPPHERPPEWARCSWDEEALRGGLGRIYDYRSRALHDGTPFPLPMCEPPWIGDGMSVAVERPRGEGTYLPAAGVRWTKDDLPMHLHTFEYIVQGALCKWWKDMVERRTDTAEGGCAT